MNIFEIVADTKCITKLFGEAKGRRQFGSARSRWEDNIKVDVKEAGQEVMVWIQVAQFKVSWWVPW